MTPAHEFDVIVLGGGLAGLCAGVRAAELGRKVAVLEQGTTARYACNSRYSGGVVHVHYHDATLPAEELTRIMRTATDDFAQPELVEAIAGNAARSVDWLRAQGAKFIRRTTGKRDGWVMAPPRSLATHLAWEGRGPDTLVYALGQRLAARGGELVLGARGKSLRMEGEECGGLVVERDGADVDMPASAVVLADGGFQGNAALFKQFIGPRPDLVLQRGAGTARGDGLLMALAVGARMTARMDRFYGHLLSRDALHNPNAWPYPQIDAVAAAGIVVDRQAKRFLDEGYGGIYIANELAKLDDPAGATVVVDAAIWEAAGREALIPPNPLLAKAGGTLLRAATLGELARAMGVPEDALAATVQSYNEAIEAGTLATLACPRTAKQMPAAIAMPPYYAIPICAGITYTMGGLAIDGGCRVQTVQGGCIDGLFAAGGTIGGLEGGPHVGYVGGLVGACTFGMRAGEGAAYYAADRRIPI